MRSWDLRRSKIPVIVEANHVPERNDEMRAHDEPMHGVSGLSALAVRRIPDGRDEIHVISVVVRASVR